MSNRYFNKRLSKCIERVNLYSYDINDINLLIDNSLEEIEKGEKLQIIMRFLPPGEDSIVIQKAYARGDIKSHELKDVLFLISEKIQSSLYSDAIQYNESLNTFRIFQKRFLCKYSYIPFYYNGKRRSLCEIDLKIASPERLERRDISSLLSVYFNETTDLSERIHIKIGKISKHQDTTVIYRKNMKKYSKSSYILTKEDKDQIVEYYSQTKIKNIIMSFLFPFNSPTRITIDKLQKDLPVKKSLRIKLHEKEYAKLCDTLSKNITIKRFSEMVSENDISCFYCGTQNKKDNLCYLLFDIDTSPFLKTLFSPQTIWELLLNFTESLIDLIKRLGIKKCPLVKFSGSRGIHIVYKFQPDILEEKYGRLNLKNWYKHLPGIYELSKTKKTPLHSPPYFSQLIADSIIFDILLENNVKIPKTIQKKLGIKDIKDLFKISAYSPSKPKILIDTIPNVKGVFRTPFSVHPKTKLVSIPIYDSEKGVVKPRYKKFKKVKLDAEMENIISSINLIDEIGDFATISKDSLIELIKPDKLLPTMCVILRFGRRFIFEHTRPSLDFWHRFYKIKFFFAHLEYTIIHQTSKEKDELKRVLYEMEKMNLYYKEDLSRFVIKNWEITSSFFHEKLQGFFYLNFYYKILISSPRLKRRDFIMNLFKDSVKQKSFLKELNDSIYIIILFLSNAYDSKGNKSDSLYVSLRKALNRLNIHQSYFKNTPNKFDNSTDLSILLNLYNVIISLIKKFLKKSKYEIKK